MPHPTTSSRRRSTLWTALLAACIVIISPIVGVTAAHADASDYVGVPSGPEGTWGDVTLAPMTVGVFYSDTVQAPPAESHTWGGLNMPAGLQVIGDGDSARIEGTPSVAGNFDFTVRSSGGDFWWNLEFTGSIAPPPLAPTTTTLTGQSIAAFSSMGLAAAVSGTNLTGQVQFYANGQPLGDPQDLLANVARFNGTDSNAGLVGSTATFTAKYLGDADNAASTSNPVDEYIYRQGDVFGHVYDNGAAVVGATIDLLLTPASPSDTPAHTTTTDGDGWYLVNIPPTSQADAEKTYVIRATFPDGTVLYYNDDANIGTQNYTDFGDAQATGPLTWANRWFSLYRNTPPTWSDDTIADFRAGSAYSDAVAATHTGVDFNSQSNALHYRVTAGSLPDGISLDEAAGTLTGTPLNDEPYDFTITANDLYGSITQEFSGTPLPVGVAPTWSDDAIGSLQQGVPFTDAVVAAGDPTIVYSVSAGALPDGLTLDAATGAITGTPTVDGEFDFTVQASNDFGRVAKQFTGTIATAVDPDLGLTLDFVPGSNIDNASTTIQASGLMVGSTYTLTLHSAPVTLYVGTVDATGGFSLPVALPTGIPAGSHSLVLTGIAPDGTVLTSTGWFSIDANGRILQISMTGPITAALAFTGADATPGLVFGGALLLAGMLFFSVARLSRRRAARNA